MIWRPIDAMAGWLGRVMGAKNQLRLGIVLCLLSVPLYVYGPFSGEPILIYLMSALAITLTGVGIVVSAQVLVNQEDESGDEPDSNGGWPPPSP